SSVSGTSFLLCCSATFSISDTTVDLVDTKHRLLQCIFRAGQSVRASWLIPVPRATSRRFQRARPGDGNKSGWWSSACFVLRRKTEPPQPFVILGGRIRHCLSVMRHTLSYFGLSPMV